SSLRCDGCWFYNHRPRYFWSMDFYYLACYQRKLHWPSHHAHKRYPWANGESYVHPLFLIISFARFHLRLLQTIRCQERQQQPIRLSLTYCECAERSLTVCYL